MNKKCSHCGLEVEDYYSKKEKMCKACYFRRLGCNKAGKTYVKVLDLPEEERERIFAHRNSIKNKSKEQEVLVPVKASAYEQKDVVMQDILNTFKDRGATWPKDFTSIVPVFQQLNVLLNNYIATYFTAEDILNKIELDYKHAKEHYSSLFTKYLNDLSIDSTALDEIIEKKALWEERHNALLEIRRGVKNVIAEYNAAGILFTELANNQEFMKRFNEALISLNKVSSILENGSYRAEVSKLVSEDKFCLGLKSNTTNDGLHKYSVTIKTMYNGIRNKQDFTRLVWAKDEADAKESVKQFIESNRDKFKFNFKDKDIVVTQIT